MSRFCEKRELVKEDQPPRQGGEGKSAWQWLATLGCLLSFVACETGGGDFVGTAASASRDVSCSLCNTDPPALPVDCARAEEGVEFLPVTIWDFEKVDGKDVASNMYTYNDGSGVYTTLNHSWQPATTPEDRCIGVTGNNVFHFRSGPFRNWGGAIGRHFKCLNGSTTYGEDKIGDSPSWSNGIGCDGTDHVKACTDVPGPDATPEQLLKWSVCPDRDKAMKMAGTDSDPGTIGKEEYLLAMTLDLSQWDGISFWARRSTDSQQGFRVAIGDKFTDDDLSYMQEHINPTDQRSCERNIECGCNGTSACTLITDKAQAPAAYQEWWAERGIVEPVDEDGNSPFSRPGCWDLSPRPDNTPVECGQQLCTDETGKPHFYDALQHDDMQRYNTTCHDYTFTGGVRGAYCYNDADPPKENSRICGDHWSYPVYLSTEWKFYKVPFTSLLQQGWAKTFDKLDLKNLSLIRFIYVTGWIEFWLDDVRVYRDTQNSEERHPAP
jgi:hypothetical protein